MGGLEPLDPGCSGELKDLRARLSRGEKLSEIEIAIARLLKDMVPFCLGAISSNSGAFEWEEYITLVLANAPLSSDGQYPQGGSKNQYASIF